MSSLSSRQQKEQLLPQLLHIRDEKRKSLRRLFDEKKRIQQQMDDLNVELFALDDQIEALEEGQEDDGQAQELPYLQQEGSIKHELEANTLTMNAEEVLTEQPLTVLTQHEQQHPSYDEHLTDPFTWTQPQKEVTPPPFHHHQRHGQSDNSMSDFFIYTDDEGQDSGGRSDDVTPPGGAASRAFKPRATSAFPPLQVHNVDRKPAAVGKRKAAATVGTGNLDAFLVPIQGPPIHATGAGTATANPSSTHRPDSTAGINAAPSAEGCPFSQNDILRALKRHFRIESFRENQLEVIQSTLSGKDCFCLMRTGGGKSLTYQLPAVLESPKITLIVSPLLSLIQDQEDQMNQFVRQSCVSFTSGMGAALHTANWNRVRDPDGGVAMILVTPEMVFKSNKLKAELQKLEQQNRLGRFVVDECHCACQWGHDFRPDYAKLSVLRHHYPLVPILAVTATASEQVRRECAQIFGLSRDFAFFQSSADRPNLTYQVRPKETANCVIEDMCTFIREKHPQGAGIVYTYSRKDADTVADQLCQRGIVAEAYHSDVSATKKNDVHRSWMMNQTQVVVATIAFGLGINKPDVRFVLHHTLSKTLEAYYQESGRAGRDGKPSDCVLYYSPKDVSRMIKMIHGNSSENLFTTMVKYAQQFGDDRACRALILQNMGEPNQDVDKFRTGLNEMVEMKDVTSHAVTLLQLMHVHQSENMTMSMLVKEWRQNPKDAPECIQNNPPGKELSPSDCERIIIGLLVNGLININCRYTAYDTVVYMVITPKAQSFILSDKACMRLPLPKRTTRASKKSIPTSTGEGGWVATKKKRPSTASSSSSQKKPAKKQKKATKTKSKRPATAKGTKASSGRKATSKKGKQNTGSAKDEVIEIIEDSDDADSNSGEISKRKASLRRPFASSLSAVAATASNAAADDEEDDDCVDDESETEWDG